MTKTKSKSQPRKQTRPVKAAIETSAFGDMLTDGRALFLIAAATILVYANSLSGEFVFDDLKQIVGNLQIHSWGNITHAFTSAVWDFQRDTSTLDLPPPYYRPFFTIYLIVGYHWFGLWPAGWHLVSIAAHTGATVMVYYLAKRLLKDRLLAAITALLFGIHAAHAESVAWISGIPDPMMALFFIPSLIWYDRFRTEGRKRFLWLSVAAFAVAVFCKETALCLPVFIAFWEVCLKEGKFADRVKRTALILVPYAVVSVGYLAARIAVLGRIGWKHPASEMIPDYLIWMTAPFSLVSYIRHLALPYSLSIVYGTSFVKSLSDPRFVWPVVFLLALAILLWLVRRKLSREAWLGIGLIVIPLLPVLNLKVFHEEYVVQDRYLYLPSIGWCLLLALGFRWLLARQKQFATALLVIVVVFMGYSTIAQNRVWQSSAALWRQAITYAPNFWSTHYNLGLAHMNSKQYAAAEDELNRALKIKPLPVIYNNLAMTYLAEGRTELVENNLKKALAMDPTFLEAHNNLGTLLYGRGDYQGSRNQFIAALRIDAASSAARFNLGLNEEALGNYPSAAAQYEYMLKHNPEDSEARYHLALTYARMNRKEEAQAALQTAMQYEPNPNRRAEMKSEFEKSNQP
jgi:tetratricopeptide (TPR) repeat protein